jgi:hypothetical protein
MTHGPRSRVRPLDERHRRPGGSTSSQAHYLLLRALNLLPALSLSGDIYPAAPECNRSACLNFSALKMFRAELSSSSESFGSLFFTARDNIIAWDRLHSPTSAASHRQIAISITKRDLTCLSLRLDECQKVGVNHLGMSGHQPVRVAGVDLQCGVL